MPWNAANSCGTSFLPPASLPQHLKHGMNTEFLNYLNLLDGHNRAQFLNWAAAALVINIPILVLK